ncbi:MAG TPA: FtsH protease activity modulator HflK [Acetobacteraceae bacterium]|jgi:membrane protease subunit HflK
MPWNNGGPGNPGGGGSSGGPWGNPGGGRQGPQGPWGGGPRGPGGGGGGQPPDLDELIARVQSFLRGLLPSGMGGGRYGGSGTGFPGGRGLALIAALVVAGWLASGFYRVQPDEQGVVLRFGAYDRTTFPGLNYHVPWPVESVLRPAVTRINRVEVGYRTAGSDPRASRAPTGASRVVPEESLMLTGDENIIDIDCAVFWRVRDAGKFLFSTRNPAYTVKSASESVMREVIGRTPIQPALTDARAQIEASVFRGVQAILDQYDTGVEITQVQLQKVDPPGAVIESFRDVQRANTDADRMRNEAQSYHNDIVPRARGDAARLEAEADAARQVSIAQSTGEAQRFLSVLTAYQAAKDVTMRRLYIETMQDILSHTPSVIVDDQLKGVVPFLPLNDLGRGAPPAPSPSLTPPAPPPAARVGAAR